MNCSVRGLVANALANEVAPGMPLWYRVGLYEFLETVRRAPDGKTMVVGAIHPAALAAYRVSSGLTIRDMRESSLPLKSANDLRGLSWLFVFWLYHTQPGALAAFQTALANGVDADRAFERAFADLGLDTLDAKLAAYVADAGIYREKVLPAATLRIPPIGEGAALSDVERHVTRARVAQVASTSLPYMFREMKKELERAAAIDPSDPSVMRLDVWTDPSALLARARCATQTRPRDFDTWLLYETLLIRTGGDASEQENAARRTVALAPRHPIALNQLAWILFSWGRAAEALPYALTAVRVRPTSAESLDTLARIYYELGRYGDALAVQERIAAHPERYDPEENSMVQERLALYRRASSAVDRTGPHRP
jgi:tetratricopeptide (TPR) repeat protein